MKAVARLGSGAAIGASMLIAERHPHKSVRAQSRQPVKVEPDGANGVRIQLQQARDDTGTLPTSKAVIARLDPATQYSGAFVISDKAE